MPLNIDGKYYNFNGKKVKLYPVARLCAELEAIGYSRDPQTIRKWELHGVTPPAIFRSGQKRIYTKEQIKVFCDTAKECDIQQGYSLAMSDFQQLIWERLEELRIKYSEGEI